MQYIVRIRSPTFRLVPVTYASHPSHMMHTLDCIQMHVQCFTLACRRIDEYSIVYLNAELHSLSSRIVRPDRAADRPQPM